VQDFEKLIGIFFVQVVG